MPKTIYGIKQKYNLKDYVRYYSAIDQDGNFCKPEEGWINNVEYGCNLNGEIELTYIIGDFVGSSSGHCVSPNRIIKKTKPKVDGSSYKNYLKYRLKCNEASTKRLNEEHKELIKKIEELD